MEESNYSEIWNYLKFGKYPEGANKDKKREIRKKCEPFLLQNEELYHKPRSKLKIERVPKKVVRSDNKEKLIRDCHENSVSGGHFGRDKTFNRISEKYYWKGMKEDVSKYISNCDHCLKNPNKPPVQALEQYLIKYPKKSPKQVPELDIDKLVPSIPLGIWRSVAMDLFGPLPESRKGNSYVCGLTDYFSKWLIAEAIPNISVEEVASVLVRAISVYGCFESLITDQSQEFIHSVNDMICTRLSIDHRITSMHYPQTDASQEHFNQIIERAIMKLVNENKDDWDQRLDGILFTYRTAQHESTKQSPFYLMFGREPLLPVDMYLKAEIKTNESGNTSIVKVETIDNDNTLTVKAEAFDYGNTETLEIEATDNTETVKAEAIDNDNTETVEVDGKEANNSAAVDTMRQLIEEVVKRS